MSATELESALRILLAHRRARMTCATTRRLIRQTVDAIRNMRATK